MKKIGNLTLDGKTYAILLGAAAGTAITLILREETSVPTPESSDDKRQALLALARDDIGKPMQREVWQDVNPSLAGVRAWCQAWYLHKLRQAGLTDAKWKMGGPFPVNLPITRTPKPGDMAYWDQPNQHGAMVETVDPLVTIDGAQAGNVVARVHHGPGSKTPIFYSIEPLL